MHHYYPPPLPQIRHLGPGVRLHAVIDACHSGSSMDLPYLAKLQGGHAQWVEQSRIIKGTSGGFAVQFAACQDSQTAADTSALSGSVNTGACTFCFIEVCVCV